MDSFQANSQFTLMLRNINPSVQSLKKAAHFAIKNWENEDYFFSTIIDVLEDGAVELNTKSTIFQFIDVLIHESFYISSQERSNYSYPYINNLKTELPKILLKVLPDSNNYNSYNVFKSLKNISDVLQVDSKSYEQKYSTLEHEVLTDEDKANIDANIPYPNIKLEDAQDILDPILEAWELLVQKRKQSYYEHLRLLKNNPAIDKDVEETEMFHLKPKDKASLNELSKRQILLRMEDDRETHKRSKESLWLVDRPKEANLVTEDEFMQYYWNRYDEISSEDAQALLKSLDDFNTIVMGSYKDNQF